MAVRFFWVVTAKAVGSSWHNQCQLRQNPQKGNLLRLRAIRPQRSRLLRKNSRVVLLHTDPKAEFARKFVVFF